MQLSTGRARKPSHVARDRIATSVALRVVHDLNRSNGRCRLTIAFYGVDVEAPVVRTIADNGADYNAPGHHGFLRLRETCRELLCREKSGNDEGTGDRRIYRLFSE